MRKELFQRGKIHLLYAGPVTVATPPLHRKVLRVVANGLPPFTVIELFATRLHGISMGILDTMTQFLGFHYMPYPDLRPVFEKDDPSKAAGAYKAVELLICLSTLLIGMHIKL